MSTETPASTKPGRPNSAAIHPQRAAIELALARGVTFEHVARAHGLSRMAVTRFWQGVPPERRAYLATLATALDEYEARVRGFFADLAARSTSPTAADRRRAAQACSRATAEALARICPPRAVAA